tara:strand:+ start:290 stop:466 length:177 start_codon:yes stop_codon:yes gene_type:complete
LHSHFVEIPKQESELKSSVSPFDSGEYVAQIALDDELLTEEQKEEFLNTRQKGTVRRY